MSEKQKTSAVGEDGGISRRRFMAGAGAAAMSFAVMKPSLVRGTEANSKIKLGMIGCGDRGKGIGERFVEHGGYEIVAAADYFRGKVDEFGEKFGVPASRRYTTLSGYKKLLASGVDAVAVESPPYFHPEQSAAAVDAIWSPRAAKRRRRTSFVFLPIFRRAPMPFTARRSSAFSTATSVTLCTVRRTL